MKTDNEVLAEFMGCIKKIEEHDGMKVMLLSGGGVPVSGWYYPNDELGYHKSFDWLMPVWYKFRDLKHPEDLWHQMKAWKDRIADAIVNSGPSPAEACKLLAKGIRWYNEIKK